MLKRMLIMIVLVAVLIAIIVAAFIHSINVKKASFHPPPPSVVTATTASYQDWQPQLHAVGSLRALRGVDVTTEIAGLVREIHFKSGDEVKVGTLLIQLNADSDIAQLHALDASAELAATVLKRDQAQLEAEAISKAQVDADMADLKSKRAQVAQQQALVDKKTIRAPFSGRLGITLINPGQYVNPGDKLVTLQTIDPVYVDFNLPQQVVGGISVGQTVTVATDTFPGLTFAGKINAINPSIDTATRNVEVEATVANVKRQLLPGMFGNVAVDIGAKTRYLTLPQTAITYNPYGSTVFIAKLDTKSSDKDHKVYTATQSFITTGSTRGDQVAVLTGLADGDVVVTSGQIKLKNGSALTIDNTVQPANDPNPKPQEK